MKNFEYISIKLIKKSFSENSSYPIIAASSVAPQDNKKPHPDHTYQIEEDELTQRVKLIWKKKKS